ncbi:nucleotidyltransferase family protein [Paraferrimonas haliotis]|uniref:nucleotidyltransferase family protein n=1 Tax=Paraferrimonas haliotis TaxID=2013866 RepID=UPI000BA99442|nr:nucleotidyltransferase family protein [Paraferrimonas haliotis]
MFEAVILAGGEGTRLKSVTGDLPKPMVDINGVPFLYRLMQRLESHGCNKIVLSLGYKADFIIERILKDRPVQCHIDFSVEKEPLGTGGAIKLSAKKISTESFVVLNGDTYCEIDYMDFNKVATGYSLMMSGIFVNDVSRYGKLKVDDNNRVISICEKGGSGPGIINSGVYVINADEIKAYERDVFSFEEDYLRNYPRNLRVYQLDGYFIDIGIPEDYLKACETIN